MLGSAPDEEDLPMDDTTVTVVRGALLGASRVRPTTGAVRRATQGIVDGLAVAMAGASESVSELTRRSLGEIDGPGDAVLWGDSRRAALGSAVYANAVATHALAWDDYTHPMHGHCTAVLLPVCSALADRVGASGDEVLAAYLAGYEVNGVLGSALGSAHYGRGWHPTSTIGAIGASAAAARMLRLDPEQTWHAMGLAASTAAGFQGNFGSAAKATHAGNAARAGLVAAQLARQGIGAHENWLLRRAGYLDVMGVQDLDAAVEAITADRGDRLVIEGDSGLILKPYCCCGSGQPMIRAVVEAVTEEEVAPDEISEVEVHVDPAVLSLLVYDRPRTPLQARYCLPYLAAVAAVDRAAGPDQFTDKSIRRPDLSAMMKRVRWRTDLVAPPHARYRAEVRIHTTAGTIERAADVPEGHPASPMSDVTRRQKFDHGSRRSLEAGAGEQLFGVLATLETLPRWSEVSSFLAGSSG